MRTFMKGTLIGTAAAALAIYPLALCVGILAEASGWSSFDVTVGSLPMFEFERTDGGTASTFGTGLMLFSLLLGTLNGAAAVLISRRQGTAPNTP